MDFLQQNINRLLSVTDTIIRREVDCMIDDLMIAKTVSVLNDSFSFNPQDFISRRLSDKEDTEESVRKDVLLCVSKEGNDNHFIEAAKEFKGQGNQVLTITANRNSALAKISDRVVGFDLKIPDTDEKNNHLLYEQVIYILFTTIKQSMEKRIPVTH